MAGLKTSRGWPRDEDSVPTETVWMPITAFLALRSTTTKRSLSKHAILPRSRRSTSPGEEIPGLSGPGSETILLPISAARIADAFASPTTTTPSISCGDERSSPWKPPRLLRSLVARSSAPFSPVSGKAQKSTARSSAGERAPAPAAKIRDRGRMSSGRGTGESATSSAGADHPASGGLAGARAASEIASGAPTEPRVGVSCTGNLLLRSVRIGRVDTREGDGRRLPCKETRRAGHRGGHAIYGPGQYTYPALRAVADPGSAAVPAFAPSSASAAPRSLMRSTTKEKPL